MENFFAGLENSSSKIRRIVLCCRRKTRTSLTSTPPFPFLFSETSKLEARVLKSQEYQKTLRIFQVLFLLEKWLTLKSRLASTLTPAVWVPAKADPGEIWSTQTLPLLTKSTAQQQQTCTKRRHPGLTMLGASGLCLALGWLFSWTPFLVCSWSLPSNSVPPAGISLHTAGLSQNYSQALQGGMTRRFP